MFYFEGNGGNKSLPARERTVDEVSRGGDRDDHHKSWKVRCQNTLIFIIIKTDKNEPREAFVSSVTVKLHVLNLGPHVR